MMILTRAEIETMGPPVPEELAETGTPEAFLSDLALKHVAMLPDPTTSLVAEQMQLPRTLAEEWPLVLLIDGDVGKSLGRLIRHEIAPRADLIAIDGVQLKEFDYVDIGEVIAQTNVVPIIIKSLLFK